MSTAFTQVTLLITKKVKMGNLPATLTHTETFQFDSDSEALRFCEMFKDDPEVSVTGYKTRTTQSAAAAFASLASIKDGMLFG